MKRDRIFSQLIHCVLPLLRYLVVYELSAALLQLLLQRLLAGAGASLRVWVSVRSGDVSALLTALAMAAAVGSVVREARREVPFTCRIHSGQSVTVLFAAAALSLALALNIFFTISGATASDAAAQAASEQTGAVSPVLGILVYGILSPFAEETIFRGITYGRLRRLLERPAAAVLSSLLFGLYHGNLVQGLYAFCMGLVFCGFLEMTHSLPAAALLHGSINVVVLLLSLTGGYGQLCSVSWLAGLSGTALCGGGAVRLLLRKDQES